MLALVFALALTLTACKKNDENHVHSIEAIAEVAATCTTDGNISYWHCTECDKYFSDEACATEISRDDTVKSKLNHPSLTHVDAKSATCKEAGCIEHWVCKDCNTYFGDGGATAVKPESEVIISSTGHTRCEQGYCTVCGDFARSDDIDFDIIEEGEDFYTMVGFITENATSRAIEAIPSSYNGKPVKVIGGVTSNNIVTLVIPSSIEKISATFAEEYNPKLQNIYYDGTIEEWCNIELVTSPMDIASNFYVRNAEGTGWEKLTDLVIPDSVTKINDRQFMNFYSVKTVNFGSGVEEIGKNAFNGCNALETVAFPENVKKIGMEAFYACYGLKTLDLGDGVTEVGNNAFRECTNLTTLTIGSKLNNIGSGAFAELHKLSTLNYNLNTAPTGVGIFYNAGKDVDSIALNFGANVTYIPKAFGGLNIGALTIGENVTEIADFAFEDCKKIAQINYNAVNATVGNDNIKASFQDAGDEENGAIVVIGAKVINIPDYLFYKTKIKELKFAEEGSLKTIGKAAFEKSYLKDIALAIPEGVTSIGDFAFHSAEITELTVPTTITAIGKAAFKCEYLTAITYNAAEVADNTVDRIEDADDVGVFTCAGSVSATETCVVNIGSLVKKIPALTFAGADITSINFAPEGACTSIGKAAFYGSEKLKEIEFPSTILSIGEWAFAHCKELKGAKPADSTEWDLTIPTSVTSVGECAFYRCEKLDNVVFVYGGACQEIGDYAFDNCVALKQIAFPNGLKTMGEGVLRNSNAVFNVSIPFIGAKAEEGRESKERQPFGYLFGKSQNNDGIVQTYFDEQGTSHSQRYLIPESIQSIIVNGGDVLSYAFSGLNMDSLGHGVSITLSDTINYVDALAFINCSYSSYGSNGVSLIPYGNQHKYVLVGFTAPSATINNSVALIADNISEGTLALTGVVVDRSFNGTILDDSFKYANAIENLTVPAEVLSYIKFPQANLTTLKIDGGTAITAKPSGCDSLTEVEIDKDITVSAVFDNISTIVKLKANASTIEYLIGRNPDITEVYVNGGSLDRGFIGDYVSIFGAHENLEVVTLGYGVTDFNARAFGQLPALQEVTVTNDNADYTSEEGVVYNKDKTSLLFYPANKTDESFTATGVRKIGDYAFNKCAGLKTLVLPATIEEIGVGALNQCTSIEELTVPFVGGNIINDDGEIVKASFFNSVFGGRAASGNNGYAELVPESLKTVTVLGGTIEEEAFYKLTHISTVVLPETLETIGESAFYHCDGLTEIAIPKSVTTIQNSAFSECGGLETLTVYNDSELTDIGAYAFYNCSSLTSVTIPEKVVNIGNCAFMNTYSLTEISFNAVAAADFVRDGRNDNEVFTGAGSESAGIALTFGNKVTKVPDNMFYSHTITSWNTADTFANVTSVSFAPESDVDVEMTIGLGAFYGFSQITSLEIPSYVTEIYENAFYGWSSITSLTLGNRLTYIGNGAFGETASLAEINYNAVSNSIYNSNASNNSPFTSVGKDVADGIVVNIGADVKSLPDCFIGGETNVKEINFANGCMLTTIGREAFNGSLITSLSLPSTVTAIGKLAFAYCKGLTELDLSGTSLASIGVSAFANCENLATVKFPETLESIGDWAFKNCGFTEMTVPDSVTAIGYGAFEACKNLVKFSTSVFADAGYGSGVTEFSSFFGVAKNITNKDKTKVPQNLTEITVTGNITEVAEYEFNGFDKIEKIDLPNSVTKIGQYAFADCKALKSVTIPEGVKTIEDRAFYNCYGLTAVYFNAISCNPTPGPHYVFENVGKESEGITLYIGAKVEKIPANLFYSYVFTAQNDVVPNVTEIIVDRENTVLTTIGNNAFVARESDRGSERNVNLPIKKLTVPAELAYTFKSHLYLTAVVVDGGEKIKDFAFSDMRTLESAEIKEGVKEIGRRAFANCDKLSALSLPSTLLTIGDEAFAGCTKLPSTTEAGAKYIGSEANPHMILMQAENTDITEVTIHSDAKYINANAFENCKSLTSVEIPNGILSIGKSAFANCSGLPQDLVIPDSVVSIGESAFDSDPEGESSYSSVTIGANVKSIGPRAFYSPTLTDVYFNAAEMDDVEQYSMQYVFVTNSANSITLHIGAGVKRIPGYLFAINAYRNYTRISNIVFADGSILEEIGESAFDMYDYDNECRLNCDLVLPETVKTIGNRAFYYTKISSLTFGGAALERVGAEAFANCALETVTVREETSESVEFAENAFNGNKAIVVNLSDLDITTGADTYGQIAKASPLVTKSANGERKKVGSFNVYESDTDFLVINYDGALPEEMILPEVSGKNYIVGGNLFNRRSGVKTIDLSYATELCNDALFGGTTLNTVTVGLGLKKIGSEAFGRPTSSITINYAGTKAQWNAIEKASDWMYKYTTYIVVCIDGTTR